MTHYIVPIDPFTIDESLERAAWYGVSGIPHVRFDGGDPVLGALNCDQSASDYRERIEERRSETGGVSPVSITGEFSVRNGQLSMAAVLEAVEPIPDVEYRATLLVYEDKFFWCCGCDRTFYWRHVTRDLFDQPVEFPQQGDSARIEAIRPLDPAWDPDKIHVLAYLQRMDATKEILQGALLPRRDGFLFESHRPVASLPDGPGTAILQIRLSNIGSIRDTYRIETTVPFGDWPTEVAVQGDPTWRMGPLLRELDGGDSAAVWVRVATGPGTNVRAGSFRATSLATLQSRVVDLRVFSGCTSILLVDDDWGNDYEQPLVRSLAALGRPCTIWDIATQGDRAPRPWEAAGFDLIIWQTGWGQHAQHLDSMVEDVLCRHVLGGGFLLLTSQSFLDDEYPETQPPLACRCMGLADWDTDERYEHLAGAAADPVSDGLDLPLTFLPQTNDDDAMIPDASGVPFLVAPDGSIGGVRHETEEGGRTVLLAFPFNALSEVDPDPNNARFLLGRILDWGRPAIPSGAPPQWPGEAAGFSSPAAPASCASLDVLGPNPLRGPAVIRIDSPAVSTGAPFRLEVMDIAGRRRAVLHDGLPVAGSGSAFPVLWTGMDDHGLSLPPGFYVLRLSALGATRCRKLVVVR